ncbi:acyl carrier protein [Lacrimispora algidixylanolytica]|uniref:Carrier domain-containing protein n=1 Tax=Lacrimispora algidixylanolytica TaxID=94868 RepID=A0A419SYD1_9FIRM|nr:acyl carrier protein [Lacrimispora algidixylanolytica]RKD30244.1 hypothetical protein BET01_06520 [Lacrimispora algidixylanolytica]
MFESVASKLLDIFKKVLDVQVDENGFFKGNLIENLNIDSLIALQLIVEIEKTFHIVIEDDELAIKLIDSPSFFIEYCKQYEFNVNTSQEAREHDE